MCYLSFRGKIILMLAINDRGTHLYYKWIFSSLTYYILLYICAMIYVFPH